MFKLLKKLKTKKLRLSEGTYRGAIDDDNIPNGHGKMKYTDGHVYEGNWKDGEPHGHGKMIYNDGNVYEGNWENGEPTEEGKSKYANSVGGRTRKTKRRLLGKRRKTIKRRK